MDPRLLSVVELFAAPLGVAAVLLVLVWFIERLRSGPSLRD